jgi:hypothetical protein
MGHVRPLYITTWKLSGRRRYGVRRIGWLWRRRSVLVLEMHEERWSWYLRHDEHPPADGSIPDKAGWQGRWREARPEDILDITS